MSAKRDLIVIFPVYDRSGAIRKLDSKPIVCKTYVFINSNLFSYKMWKQLKIVLHSSHTIALSKGTIFVKKFWFFAKKMLKSAKLRGPWYWKVYLFETTYVCELTYQISNLYDNSKTSFKQKGKVILPPPPPQLLPQNESLKSPPRLELNWTL